MNNGKQLAYLLFSAQFFFPYLFLCACVGHWLCGKVIMPYVPADTLYECKKFVTHRKQILKWTPTARQKQVEFKLVTCCCSCS
jgi:hypothetical protein